MASLERHVRGGCMRITLVVSLAAMMAALGWPLAGSAQYLRMGGGIVFGPEPNNATLAPRLASSWAVHRPMPDPPPVTMTTCPANKPGLKTLR